MRCLIMMTLKWQVVLTTDSSEVRKVDSSSIMEERNYKLQGSDGHVHIPLLGERLSFCQGEGFDRKKNCLP